MQIWDLDALLAVTSLFSREIFSGKGPELLATTFDNLYAAGAGDGEGDEKKGNGRKGGGDGIIRPAAVGRPGGGGEPPTAEEVEAILQAEYDGVREDLRRRRAELGGEYDGSKVGNEAAALEALASGRPVPPYPENEPTRDYVRTLANTYALAYSVVHELQVVRGVPLALYAGSHLGANRHHGIIPFQEKDVDFAVFSTDTKLIQEGLDAAVRMHSDRFNATVVVTGSDVSRRGRLVPTFGWDIRPANEEEAKKRGGGALPDMSHYIDVWMFGFSSGGRQGMTNQTVCVGWHGTGCARWFRYYHTKPPPPYGADEWFPFRYHLFGTHLVPIPAKDTILEKFPLTVEAAARGVPKFWNATCGPWRTWTTNRGREGWRIPPLSERSCSHRYGAYPFVFVKDAAAGSAAPVEQLRQGSTVLHTVAAAQ